MRTVHYVLQILKTSHKPHLTQSPVTSRCCCCCSRQDVPGALPVRSTRRRRWRRRRRRRPEARWRRDDFAASTHRTRERVPASLEQEIHDVDHGAGARELRTEANQRGGSDGAAAAAARRAAQAVQGHARLRERRHTRRRGMC